MEKEYSGGKLGPPKERKGMKPRECLVCGKDIHTGDIYVYVPYWYNGAMQERVIDGESKTIFRPWTLAFCSKACLEVFSLDKTPFMEKVVSNTAFIQTFVAGRL